MIRNQCTRILSKMCRMLFQITPDLKSSEHQLTPAPLPKEHSDEVVQDHLNPLQIKLLAVVFARKTNDEIVLLYNYRFPLCIAKQIKYKIQTTLPFFRAFPSGLAQLLNENYSFQNANFISVNNLFFVHNRFHQNDFCVQKMKSTICTITTCTWLPDEDRVDC